MVEFDLCILLLGMRSRDRSDRSDVWPPGFDCDAAIFWFLSEGKKVTLGLASVVHSMVTWVLTGAPISWFGMYIIGWTEIEC